MTVDSRRWTEPAGLRVYVDGTPASHQSAQGVRVVLAYSTGEVAEVQVAKVGDALVVIAAGEVQGDRDPKGHTRLRVWPTS